MDNTADEKSAPAEEETPITYDGLDALDADVGHARSWGGWLGVGVF